MARFQVRFMKDVCNDTGHARSVLQRVVNIEASSADRACDEACMVFSARENVGHWRDHADRIEVMQVNWCDLPESAPRPAGRPDENQF